MEQKVPNRLATMPADRRPRRPLLPPALCSFHHRQVHEGGFEISLTPDLEVKVWTPDGHRLSGAPTLTPDPGTIDWLAGEWNERDGEWPATAGPMPPPLWDGDRVDYEACVDALMVS